jgi:DegV family protein with EDD domain
MRRVWIITDSSACFAPSEIAGLPLRVLPITIHLSSHDLQDGTPGAAETVYRILREGEEVKSSAPSPLDYLGAVDEADGDGIVIITPAAEFTEMYRNASVAAEVAERPVAVVDSRTAAAAQGLVVRTACEVAVNGGSVNDVVEAAERAAERAELVAALEGVDTLRRSGRVPAAVLEIAHQMGLRPVFRLQAGEVRRVGITRSAEASLRRIRREADLLGWTARAASSVFHASAPSRAQELLDLLGTTGPVTEFSPSMGIHTGPGVVGVAWLRQT